MQGRSSGTCSHAPCCPPTLCHMQHVKLVPSCVPLAACAGHALGHGLHLVLVLEHPCTLAPVLVCTGALSHLCPLEPVYNTRLVGAACSVQPVLNPTVGLAYAVCVAGLVVHTACGTGGWSVAYAACNAHVGMIWTKHLYSEQHPWCWFQPMHQTGPTRSMKYVS